jgi:MFS family permease
MDQDPSVRTPQESHALLGIRDQIALSFFWFALNLQSAALLPIVLPAQIILFVTPGAAGNAQQAIFLGWLSALGAVLALVVQPIVGALSDSTPGPFGRRRPHIVAGTLLLIVGIVGLGLATDVSIFVLAFIVMNIGSNASTAAYQGLLPDKVPAQQRGAASGYMGLMTILGNVGSLALAAVLLSQVGTGASTTDGIRSGAANFYALSSVVVLVGLLTTVVGVREAPLAGAPVVGVSERGFAGLYRRTVSLWTGPWQHRNFTWVFLTRCFVMLGLTLFLTFIEYYFASVAQVPNYIQATAAIAALALAGAVLSALVCGIASDRIRRVPLVCLSTAFMTVAALAFVIAPERVPLWPLGIIFGLGYGAYTSVDWALAVDALPAAGAAGKDMGLWNIASTLPAILAPLLGSLIIASSDFMGETALGYRIVFGVAAIFLMLGAAFVLKVQETPRPNTRPDDDPILGNVLGA